MCERFEEWKDEIKKYCEENNLSFEKAKKMSKGSNKDMLLLQYYDPDSEEANTGLGLMNETPLPPVLWVLRTEDGVEFEQTEYTQQYLAL